MTSHHREARQAVVREWDRWIKTQPLDGKACARDARRFFLEIKARREPTLLDFRSSDEDKWQIVNQWLMAEKRISS
ncbi:hypothetical protein H8A97_15905 [Bradyrhizobium sp. Arg62]|uniref:hypothetical protein n=1 Tax=Bradyrhizobium brasilense TaxID=1419277 RepID=UPI001E3229B5|nr:hypothetical protein [Bradyrhizobium brasilense]MCC8946554.1 hypothetical protein [Bradyrhizobium brasilense]